MKVADQFQQVAVGIEQKRLVPPLEEMSGAFVFTIDKLGVAKPDILHDPGEGNVSDLKGEMNVRGHEAIGMDARPEALDAFLEQQEKSRTVTRIEEDVLATITAKDDVVNSAGIMKSRFTWHG